MYYGNITSSASTAQVFVSAVAPSGGMHTGDIWIDSTDGSTYIYDGTNWNVLLAAHPFDVAIHPDPIPANDSGKVVGLDLGGKIDKGFLPAGALDFRGSIDVTTAIDPTLNAVDGFTYFANKDGTIDASFTGIGGQTVKSGDMVSFMGGRWHLTPASNDLSAYVHKAGDRMLPGDNTRITFSPATVDGSVVVLDAAFGAIDQAFIDGGTF